MERKQVLDALAALANETRLEIVRILVRRGPEGVPAGEIADAVQASASRLSFHLNTLEQAGLVSALRKGRQVFYRLERPAMGGVIGYLLSDCCADDPQVQSCCQLRRQQDLA